MAILNTGRNKIIEYLKTDITKGQMGTDGTLFNANQSGVLAPDTSTEFAVTNSNITNGLKIQYELPEGAGNETSFREFELISADDTNRYSRIVFPQLDKTSDVVFSVDTYLEIDINNE